MTPRQSTLVLATVGMISCAPVATLAQSNMAEYEIANLGALEFVPLAEGSPVEISVLWGDLEVGPVGFFARFPPGFEAPLHTHTAGYRAVVIEGSALHWIEGEDKDAIEPVGPGGYWFQPGGQPHGDANPTDEGSLALIIFDGPFDFIPIEQ